VPRGAYARQRYGWYPAKDRNIGQQGTALETSMSLTEPRSANAGASPSSLKITIPILQEKKHNHVPISALTAYDYAMGRLVDESSIDLVLVGDSLAMVMLGYESTLPVTMDEMVLFTRAVRRGVRRALLAADMPYASYHVDAAEGVRNALRFVQEAGAEAVKVEGGRNRVELVQRMTDAEMIGHFQSLGDNCEFGFVTRSLGSERLQLLQWSSIKPGQLLEMLLRKFEGYADPDKMSIDLGGPPERLEFLVRDHAYGSVGHTWIFQDTERAEGFEQAHIQRLRFLRNKFFEDLEEGSHILVYRSAYDLPLALMRDLAEAVRALGPSILFWVSLASDAGRQPGEVEWADQYLLRGYIDQFAPDHAVYEGKVDMWIRLCRLALEAIVARYPDVPVVAEITG